MIRRLERSFRVLVLIASVPSAIAASLPRECLSLPLYKRVIPLKEIKGGTANYWTNAIDDDHLVSWGGITDLRTGEVAGSFTMDPYPTPDGKWMTLPGLKFFSLADFKRGSEATYVDPDLSLDYQSIGLVSKTGTKTIYRALIRELKSQDYEVDSSVTPPRFRKVGPAKVICSNLGAEAGRSSTPILSKDGKLVSFETTDSKGTQSSGVYSVNWQTGECTLLAKIGTTASKVQFNYAGDRVTYLRNATEREKERDPYEPDQVPVVFDLKTKKSYAIPAASARREMFLSPTFLPNGKLVLASETLHDGRLPNQSSRWIVDIERFIADSAPASPVGCDPAKNPFRTVSDLLKAICQLRKPSSAVFKLTAGLSESDCRRLVADYYESLPEKVRKRVSLDAYGSVCQSLRKL